MMTNPEALNLLTQAASLARMTKQEHIQIEQAVSVLRKIIEKRPKRPKGKTD